MVAAMVDQVRLWSDELARDPSSLVFLPLAETLRRRGQLDLARRVAARGVDRHPHSADAHDQLARIHADAGELDAAFDQWEMVLRLLPGHVGAIKGLAFIRFQQGHFEEAERLLLEAQETAAGSEDVLAAIKAVRRSGGVTPMSVPVVELSADPKLVFTDVLAPDQSAMMLDSDGLVLAGSYYAADGRDVTEEVGATLSGVSSEAQRATKHLQIGAWRAIVFETEAAVVSIAPTPEASGPAAGGLLLLAAPPNTPLGLLRRLLDKCLARAVAWLGGGQGR
jgi:predicted regulator of Ras-like GTPase activity (Roadblock/LC7/MglB family)